MLVALLLFVGVVLYLKVKIMLGHELFVVFVDGRAVSTACAAAAGASRYQRQPRLSNRRFLEAVL
jgi:hypothetical protein